MNIKDIFKRNLTDKDRRVIDVIDEVEAEMKKIGFWEEKPKNITINNYAKAPTFELWLQCVFIPNARKAAKNGKYPDTSQVGVMAMREYDYHSYEKKAQHLLSLLHTLDELIVIK